MYRGDYDTLGDRLPRIDWSKEVLKPFQKNFYEEHSEVAEMSQSETNKVLDELKVTVKGKDVPRPVSTFEQAKFPKYIFDTLKAH